MKKHLTFTFLTAAVLALGVIATRASVVAPKLEPLAYTLQDDVHYPTESYPGGAQTHQIHNLFWSTLNYAPYNTLEKDYNAVWYNTYGVSQTADQSEWNGPSFASCTNTIYTNWVVQSINPGTSCGTKPDGYWVPAKASFSDVPIDASPCSGGYPNTYSRYELGSEKLSIDNGNTSLHYAVQITVTCYDITSLICPIYFGIIPTGYVTLDPTADFTVCGTHPASDGTITIYLMDAAQISGGIDVSPVVSKSGVKWYSYNISSPSITGIW